MNSPGTLPPAPPPNRHDRRNGAVVSDNERMILDVVRRHEPIERAAITGRTNLTQQSVHRLLEGLMQRGLLRAGAAPKGKRGQPSPAIELADDAVYSVGISVNTDSVILCLANFRCEVVEEVRLTDVPKEREATLMHLRERLDAVLKRHRIGREKLTGLGFAMSGFFISPAREFNAPEPLRDWSLIDLRPELGRTFDLPVWVENNANTGAIGESLRGAGLSHRTFAYLSFNYGFGGGIVIDGKPYFGSHGNAGEISGIYDAEASLRRPALQYLIAALRREGIEIETIEDLRLRFDPTWPGVDVWLDKTMPALNQLIETITAVIDPEAIVFGGQLSPELGRMMIERVRLRAPADNRYGIGAPRAKLLLSQIQGDAAAIGAALIPLKVCYFL